MSPFNSLMRDTISIIKKNGQILNNIKASVQKNKIYINDGKLEIEENDIVIRILPSGIVEEYIILDIGFHKGFGSIPDNYQMTVKKKNIMEIENNKNSFNFIADNGAQVYINSEDNSVNIELDNQLFSNLISELKSIDRDLISDELKADLIKDVKELESIKNNKAKFGMKFTEFIGKTGSIIQIISPYIELLSKFI